MPAATRRDTLLPPSATPPAAPGPERDPATDEQPAPSSRSATDGAIVRPSTADKLAALSERIAALEVGARSHETAGENRHDEVMRTVSELRQDFRVESAGMKKLFMAQLGVVVLVVCVLAGIVGLRVVLDGKGGISVDPHSSPASVETPTHPTDDAQN